MFITCSIYWKQTRSHWEESENWWLAVRININVSMWCGLRCQLPFNLLPKLIKFGVFHQNHLVFRMPLDPSQISKCSRIFKDLANQGVWALHYIYCGVSTFFGRCAETWTQMQPSDLLMKNKEVKNRFRQKIQDLVGFARVFLHMKR